MRAFRVVDVFTETPLLGNPVAVVLDAGGLSTEDMQAIARWTNLSETTFLLPPTVPGADYRLRIFTPRSELPFAGHPTLGSAHAALEAGRIAAPRGRLVQECAAGLVDLALTEGRPRRLTLKLPKADLRDLRPDEAAALTQALGAEGDPSARPALVDVGPKWVIAALPSAQAVLDLAPDFAKLAAFERASGATGVTVYGPWPDGAEAHFEVRSFAPSDGIEEDPVCGSGNGAVAVFRRERGLIPPEGAAYVAAQGACVGRRGRVEVGVDAEGRVTVGGACVTGVEGGLNV